MGGFTNVGCGGRKKKVAKPNKSPPRPIIANKGVKVKKDNRYKLAYKIVTNYLDGSISFEDAMELLKVIPRP